ncbi:transposase [Roseobacter sp.]|uniref:integrase core domain-containing protein n=1 Tax=Roseobacter sp. TaxID=1907202 RepID=UPI0038640E93
MVYKTKIDWHYFALGKPTQNAFIESFNRSFQYECLNESPFSSLADAQKETTKWKENHNQNRPHSSLSNLKTNEFAAKNTRAKADRIMPEINHEV